MGIRQCINGKMRTRLAPYSRGGDAISIGGCVGYSIGGKGGSDIGGSVRAMKAVKGTMIGSCICDDWRKGDE